MSKRLLSAQSVSKSFGGIHALRSLSFDVFSAEVLGIMGPNGSGKTVLFDVISGFVLPDTGRIEFGPEKVDLCRLRPCDRHPLGITRTYQHLNLFESMSVIENTAVGLGPNSALQDVQEMVSARRRLGAERRIRNHCGPWLELFGDRLRPRADDPCLSLSYANRRRLELARSIAPLPKLVLLDEPTAGMNPHETGELQQLVSALSKKGVSFLIIEHKMFFLEDLADRIMVMAEGRSIAVGSIQEIRNNASVVEAYLGEDVASEH